MEVNNYTSGGIGFVGVLQIVFIVLKKCPTLVRYIPCGREAVAGSIVCKDMIFPRNNQICSQKNKEKSHFFTLNRVGKWLFLWDSFKLLEFQTSHLLFKIFASFNQNLPSVFDDYTLVVGTYFLASQIIHFV